MRIHDAYTKLDRLDRGAVRHPGVGATKSDTRTSDASVASTVKISAEAVSLSAPSARVSELKDRVQRGAFAIDASAIAAKLTGQGEG
jgi:anti-sigma28 factor (negative regulator of flagellin synthesis)